MDSQDMFADSQPLPERKFIITYGEMWDFKVRKLGRKPIGGLYSDHNLGRILTETNLAIIDLSNPEELESKVSDAFKLAKITIKSRLQTFVEQFAAVGRKWGRKGLNEHDVFFRLNDYGSLIPSEERERWSKEFFEGIPGSPPGSQPGSSQQSGVSIVSHN